MQRIDIRDNRNNEEMSMQFPIRYATSISNAMLSTLTNHLNHFIVRWTPGLQVESKLSKKIILIAAVLAATEEGLI